MIIFLGPYFCRRKIYTELPVEIWQCVNKGCKAFLENVRLSKSPLCSQCGSSLLEISMEERVIIPVVIDTLLEATGDHLPQDWHYLVPKEKRLGQSRKFFVKEEPVYHNLSPSFGNLATRTLAHHEVDWLKNAYQREEKILIQSKPSDEEYEDFLRIGWGLLTWKEEK